MVGADSKTRADFLAGAGEMGERVRNFPWKDTPLGAIEYWPQPLKSSVDLILSSQHPMWIGWGPEMTFLYNDAYVHVLGAAKHPNALGRRASEVWGEIWNVCGPLADKVFERGEASFVDDVRLFMDRGHFLEETFYSFSYSPIRDEAGKVCGLFCPSTDVTLKVLHARRLGTLSDLAAHALKEKTTAAACATAADILRKNPDDIPFALLYLADEASGQATLKQVIGQFEPEFPGASQVSLADHSDAAFWPIGEVFQTARRQTVSVRQMKGIPYGVAGRPVADALVLPVTVGGEYRPYGILVAGVNPCRPLDAAHVTFFEMVAAQVATAIQNARGTEEDKRSTEMLAELNRAKTAFFSNVSHEFRTPLTLMLGPLERLLEKPEDLCKEQREQLTTAHRNSLRLLKLVNSLLDFSRIEAGRLRACYRPTDLSAFTADLASNFRSAMEDAGLELIIDCAQLPEQVFVDREMWEKIVLNLLSNAFKFTFDGEVTVRLEAQGRDAVLTVSDTGTGIPEKELPHIFQRFHRIKGAKGRTHEGTGIGLALVDELVKVHGGNISVQSRLGEGSVFTVRLPFGSDHLPADQIQLAQEAEPADRIQRKTYTVEAKTWLSHDGTGRQDMDQNGESSRRSRTKGRILVADDNADMRNYVAGILEEEYDVITATNGRQALDVIRKKPPDLVLSDVMMPGLDGFELLQAIRIAASTQTLPVIFLSARAGEEARVEGLLAGADDYLTKPFTAAELRARIFTHMQMAAARRRALEQEAELRRSSEALLEEAETLNEISRALSSELDLQTVVQTVTDAARKLTAAKFAAFFYNVEDKEHQRYLLYASSGAGPEDFEDLESLRNTSLFKSTFRGACIRRDDIFQDARYGKTARYIGSPTEHLPIRSYLAVPVISRRQEVLGGLFFAHPLPGVFTQRAERIAAGIAAHAAIAIDNARLFEKAEREIRQRREAEKELRNSERRFREMIDAIPAAIYTTDAEGRLTHYNPAAVRLSGREPELGSDRWCVTWKLFRLDGTLLPHEESPMAVVLKGRTFDAGVECMAERPDGTRFYFTPYPKILRDESGRIAGGVNMLVDCTERKAAEEALRRSEERFRGVFNSSAIGVAVLTLERRFLQANQAFCNITGYSEEELKRLDCASLIHPEDIAEMEKQLAQLLSGECSTFTVEERYLRKDGRIIWVQSSVSSLNDAKGEPENIISLCEDITDRKRAEDAAHHLAAIVDSSEDAIISKDLNGIIQSWNKGAERLFGYTADEVIGKSITILIPEDRQEEEPAILERLERGERVEHFETIRRRKDGVLRDISLTISPVRNNKGRIVGASKIARDITEHKLAERALQASETRFRQLADSMPQMVWTARPDGYLDYFNERWYDFSGCSRDTFGDTSWSPLVHPEDLERCSESWYESIHSGKPYTIEHRFWDRQEKKWRWFMARALAARDADRKIVKWFGTWTDIDEQKRVEGELRRANLGLEQFAYSASHDLQEPLRSVKIYSELLTRYYRDKLDGRALEFCKYLSDGATRMEMLVHDLLDYTQVTKTEPGEENTDANQALEETLANLKGIISESGARINSDPLPTVRMNGTHLRQLFQNLISNAIKYRSAEREPVIHVSATGGKESWVFSVKDNGIGIAPEYRERIFGLFKRLHSGKEYAGTGIGLAICQRIMERYHGHIWAESVPGEGSTFLFRVPV